MEVMRRLLVSRLLWTVMVVFGMWSLTNIALRGLAKDTRFLASSDFTHARGPAWGGDLVLEPVIARLERLGPVNLFDQKFEDKVRGALGEVPGVASVTRIRRYWPRP